MSKEVNQNIIDEAIDRYIEQFKNKDLNEKLMRALLAPTVEIEQASADIVNFWGLENADGAQLDGIGDNIGEARGGRTDTQYREALRLRVFINTSGGTPDEIIDIASQLTNSDTVLYSEIYPASYQLFLDGDLTTEDIGARLRQVSPAGVGSIILNSSFGETPFAFEFTPQLGGTFAEAGVVGLELDDGSGLTLDDGEILGVYARNDAELENETENAGAFTEVFVNV